jgi:hypothetical protein
MMYALFILTRSQTVFLLRYDGGPVDIVVANAIIHWLYACTEQAGTLDALVGRIAALVSPVRGGVACIEYVYGVV